MMNAKGWMTLFVVALLALSGCGESEVSDQSNQEQEQNNQEQDNQADNATNNETNNTANNATNNAGNDEANGETNNTANNSTNNATNNSTNNSTNNATNNATNGGTTDAVCQPDFGEADACGGDVSGSWTLQEVCTDFDPAQALNDLGCTGAEFEVFEVSGTGELVVSESNFARDLTYTVNGEGTIPGFCTLLSGGCQGMGEDVEAFFGDEAEVDVVCEDSEGGQGPQADCDCTIDGTYTQSASGTYSTDGGVITVSETETQYYYCADSSSNSLTLRAIDDQGVSAVELYAGQ